MDFSSWTVYIYILKLSDMLFSLLVYTKAKHKWLIEYV